MFKKRGDVGMEDALLEPLKGYQSIYKEEHLKNVNAYFDELVKKGNVDIAANKKTVADYKAKLLQIDNIKKLISRKRTLKIFLILLIVIVDIVAVALSYASFYKKTLPIWVGIIAVVAAVAITIGFILLIRKKINVAIKHNEELKSKLEAEAKKILETAWSQMAGLNALYDWGIAGKLMSKTIPLLEIDQHFDEKKFTYLHEKYGLGENTEDNVSTYFCQSGSILGNPFLLCQDYEQQWQNKRYTGTLTIHWTETVHTKDGTRRVHRSQTLVASVWRPAPVYGYSTYLIYGNEAAPNLKFSRKPTVTLDMDEKDIEKKVKRGAKRLDKKAREAVANQGNYTRLGNDEFEVLFGGTDRNNEVEYRMLFTPLAQQNLLDLIQSKEPFGDDFIIQKDCELNFVKTRHSQTADYYGNPLQFVDYDYENAKKKFINYNMSYFTNLYFELAPLMSIPLYQQHKSIEYVYDREFKANISSYEHEALANSFDIRLLRPEKAATPSILKTNLIRKEGIADEVEITAHAFEAYRRVTYVPVWGGDGRTHMVPVFWLEYLPVEKKTTMAVEQKNSSRFEFNSLGSDFKNTIGSFSQNNACLYERGLLAVLLARELTQSDVSNLNKVYAGDPIAKTATKPTIEEIVRSVQQELDRLESEDRNETDDQATEALLKDESLDTEEVEFNEEEMKEKVEEQPTSDEDEDDDEE